MPARPTNDLSAVLNGVPVYKGVVVATTTKNNHDTAVPFENTGEALKGRIVMLQSDAAFYFNCGTTNGVTATTSNGVLVAAGERVILLMGSTYGWIACLAVSGTANVKFWELV